MQSKPLELWTEYLYYVGEVVTELLKIGFTNFFYVDLQVNSIYIFSSKKKLFYFYLNF